MKIKRIREKDEKYDGEKEVYRNAKMISFLYLFAVLPHHILK